MAPPGPSKRKIPTLTTPPPSSSSFAVGARKEQCRWLTKNYVAGNGVLKRQFTWRTFASKNWCVKIFSSLIPGIRPPTRPGMPPSQCVGGDKSYSAPTPPPPLAHRPPVISSLFHVFRRQRRDAQSKPRRRGGGRATTNYPRKMTSPSLQL